MNLPKLQKLDVRYQGFEHDWSLGSLLAISPSEVYFEYSPQAIEAGIEFSPYCYPLKKNTYRCKKQYLDYLPGFIADSLPDGWGRLLTDSFLLKKYNISSYQITALQRLWLLANNAIGALSYQPRQSLIAPEFNLQQLAQSIQHLVTNKDIIALEQLVYIGGSPQGARPKALIRYDITSNIISTNQLAKGEDWLVKFPAQHETIEVCALENLYAKLARKSGIDVPASKYFRLNNDMATFAIKRFDRTAQGQRIHLMSLAGSLDLDFRMLQIEYNDFLGFTYYLTKDKREVYQAFLRCVFNLIFNNRDDHCKNFAFLLNQQNNWQLAPGYDLTFCEGLSGQHQMSIMGEGLKPGIVELNKLADKHSLNKNKVAQIIQQVADVAVDFSQLAMQQEDLTPTTINYIKQFIDKNLSRIAG